MTAIDLGKLVVVAVLLCGAGCDQTAVTLPDNSGSGGQQCGAFYPGGAADAGAAGEYAVAEGATFPCLVWDSVQAEGEDTWFNAGELYLEVAHGLRDEKAIVLILSGTGCPTCVEVIEAIVERQDQFEHSAVMIGAALAAAGTQQEPFTLEGAVEQLVDVDGWPVEWMVTNDAESYLSGYQSFPWIAVVRLSDMQVVVHSNETYSSGNIDELATLVQGL